METGSFEVTVRETSLLEFDEHRPRPLVGAESNGTFQIYVCNTGGYLRLAQYAGREGVPLKDECIHVHLNDSGEAVVTGWFIQEGYLGVTVKLLDPPDWFLKQNGNCHSSHCFGTEFRRINA